MKKREIKSVLAALKSIKMPKIEDHDLRNAIIKNHIFLLGQAKKYESSVEDLRTAHLGPYEEELSNVQLKQVELASEKDESKRKALVDEINSHTDLLEAINGFNKAVADLDNEDVEITLIDPEKFAEEYAKQDYDMNVVEALAPMFIL